MDKTGFRFWWNVRGCFGWLMPPARPFGKPPKQEIEFFFFQRNPLFYHRRSQKVISRFSTGHSFAFRDC
jgi:hypothetical protein